MSRHRKFLLAALGAFLALGAALAWRIHTWGRSLPVGYAPVESSGSRSEWKYRRAQDGAEFVARDDDSDGTVDRVAGGAGKFERPAAATPEARWLILCLDGVPYDELLGLWGEGRFREFFRPVPVISPFPSASGLALSALFHTGQVAGYEDGYFDRAQNALSGGAWKTTTLAAVPYVERLDYDLPGWSRGLAYVLPVKTYRADLSRLRARFLKSEKKVFLAHLATTDSIYHVAPRAEARALLLEVDSLLRELYYDAGGHLRITLFSDHGNSLAQGRPVPLASHLAASGFRLADRLEGPRDVVVPAYGLIGFFAAYCQPESRAELAEALSKMHGVDLVVYREAESFLWILGGQKSDFPDWLPPPWRGSWDAVLSLGGRARLVWAPEGRQFRYEALERDPLKLAPAWRELEATGKLTRGFASDADLFVATASGYYPDAGRRLYEFATNHVRNRADVGVSLRPGYHQGSRVFDRIVTMLSTHGALDRGQSLGFAMSTDAPLAGPVRAAHLLPQEPKSENRKTKTD